MYSLVHSPVKIENMKQIVISIDSVRKECGVSAMMPVVAAGIILIVPSSLVVGVLYNYQIMALASAVVSAKMIAILLACFVFLSFVLYQIGRKSISRHKDYIWVQGKKEMNRQSDLADCAKSALECFSKCVHEYVEETLISEAQKITSHCDPALVLRAYEGWISCAESSEVSRFSIMEEHAKNLALGFLFSDASVTTQRLLGASKRRMAKAAEIVRITVLRRMANVIDDDQYAQEVDEARKLILLERMQDRDVCDERHSYYEERINSWNKLFLSIPANA